MSEYGGSQMTGTVTKIEDVVTAEAVNGLGAERKKTRGLPLSLSKFRVRTLLRNGVTAQ